MISKSTIKELEKQQLCYILGVRMHLVKEVRNDVLPEYGEYQGVYPEGVSSVWQNMPFFPKVSQDPGGPQPKGCL